MLYTCYNIINLLFSRTSLALSATAQQITFKNLRFVILYLACIIKNITQSKLSLNWNLTYHYCILFNLFF